MDDAKLITGTDEKTAWIRTVPGVRPIAAAALKPSRHHCNASDAAEIAALLGLVPKQHSTGGKERLGRVWMGRFRPTNQVELGEHGEPTLAHRCRRGAERAHHQSR